MQVILREDEYRQLKSLIQLHPGEYEKWITRVGTAQRDCGRAIIAIVKPYVENNPYYSINPEKIANDLKAAFKPLLDEIENHPKANTEI